MVKRYFSYDEINELALNEPTKPVETTEMHYFKVVKKEPLTVQGVNKSGITNVFILKPGWRMGYQENGFKAPSFSVAQDGFYSVFSGNLIPLAVV